MDCAINPDKSDFKSESEYEKILEEMGQTGDRKIEVIPKGCKPVSEDICDSGFMAPSENVTFPENAVATCCKCKEGEECEYCTDKNNCTDEEKDKYVTNKDCFTEEVVIGPSTQEPETEPEPENTISKWKWYILAAVILMLGLVFMFIRRRRSTQIP
jgi:hypothetical protein